MQLRQQRSQQKQFRLTQITLLVGIFFIVVAHIFELDYFEFFFEFLERYEAIELDEIILLLMLLAPALFADYLMLSQVNQVKKKQLQVFRATMINVNHTVNNLLNQLQYFHELAAEHKPLSPEDLVLFEQAINAATEDIEALNQVESIPTDLTEGIKTIRFR
ncbi:hypothetical protein [Almyronema epifaneia]|uniref:Histidine kinase n=1 Tax=Almyronema epifaneia S1 TaxID=2991925 RepID=A0ABW6IFJ0_9CYAN